MTAIVNKNSHKYKAHQGVTRYLNLPLALSNFMQRLEPLLFDTSGQPMNIRLWNFARIRAIVREVCAFVEHLILGEDKSKVNVKAKSTAHPEGTLLGRYYRNLYKYNLISLKRTIYDYLNALSPYLFDKEGNLVPPKQWGFVRAWHIARVTIQFVDAIIHSA